MDETSPQGHSPNYPSSPQEFERREPTIRRSNWPVYLLTIALVAANAIGYMYASAERQQRRDLAAANQSLASSLAQIQTQLQSVSERVSNLVAPLPAPTPIQNRPRVRSTAHVRAVRKAPSLGNIQSQLSEQQKQIASAREDINRTNSDLSQTRDVLQSNINTTKDELNGSIARTHDEVVVLQKRGERSYYEFAIDKSKQYSRVGPLSVGLRKADTKHKRFDLMLLVDDNELQKKSVNLYETVWISLSDRPLPIELVVNKITKDHVEGYLSEPKYKRSEFQSSALPKPAGAALQH
jgi:hypothetical protein